MTFLMTCGLSTHSVGEIVGKVDDVEVELMVGVEVERVSILVGRYVGR